MTDFPVPILSASRPLVLLGCGNMGLALLRGWRARGLPADHVFIVDPGLKGGFDDLGISDSQVASGMPSEVTAGLIMLAVKPQMLEAAAPSIAAAIDKDTALLSIMAGATIRAITAHLPGSAGCVRTMPNTPSAIGQGVTALYAPASITADIKTTCDTLMQAAGATVWVDAEADLNAVTGVSGSGPAYVFHMIEALAAAGIEQGLAPDVAETLAIETVAGAGALAAKRMSDPTTLRVQVTSPNGTTQAGLEVLMNEGDGLTQLIKRTVDAARRRADELAAD